MKTTEFSINNYQVMLIDMKMKVDKSMILKPIFSEVL
ncbi:hypothetical protein QE390_004906 [Siphonobacter sp. SORGH_AS 1065]|nr:hypothetical protein [Siphonobacter sp. SORGH_AS_1065]